MDIIKCAGDEPVNGKNWESFEEILGLRLENSQLIQMDVNEKILSSDLENFSLRPNAKVYYDVKQLEISNQCIDCKHEH